MFVRRKKQFQREAATEKFFAVMFMKIKDNIFYAHRTLLMYKLKVMQSPFCTSVQLITKGDSQIQASPKLRIVYITELLVN